MIACDCGKLSGQRVAAIVGLCNEVVPLFGVLGAEDSDGILVHQVVLHRIQNMLFKVGL